VLFRGGLLDADEPLAEADAVGLGVDDILITDAASSCEISDMHLLSSGAANNSMTTAFVFPISVYRTVSVCGRSTSP
jgi:hypothetical protein